MTTNKTSASPAKDFLRFTAALILLTILLLTLTMAAIPHMGQMYIPTVKIYFTFLLLFSVTLLVHYLLLRATAGRPEAFVRRFMLTSVVKLFIYLAFVLITSFTDRHNAVPFLLLFFILYLVFTSFEAIFLFRQVRKNS